MKCLRTLLATVILILLQSSTSAETLKFECHFSFYSSIEGMKSDGQPFTFDIHFDSVSRDAFVQGSIGISPIEVNVGNAGISFIEKLGSGATNVTTINQRGFAVHSRHPLIGGGIVASQYYGECPTFAR